MDRYAVMGNPVSHSKSPAIHSSFAEQTGQALEYTAMEVAPDGFAEAVSRFFAGGGKGLNVTVPFKQEAWHLADMHSEDALHAGAVNTLFRDPAGALQGHNTDGIGLIRDILQNHQGILQDRNILVLGAGGASRGIILPLLREQPRLLYIANRTVSKAEFLVQAFNRFGSLDAGSFEDLAGQRFDWVINATSASLQGELPPLPAKLLAPGAWCYDLMYGAQETVFCRWAWQAGATQAVDGLGMLVEQAAESFYLWRGVRPRTAAVIAASR